MSSIILDSTLPKTEVIQGAGKRRRVEQIDFIMIRRPLFDTYEEEIFGPYSFHGLTGPQGFGQVGFSAMSSGKICLFRRWDMRAGAGLSGHP